jgi:hypothetical protein
MAFGSEEQEHKYIDALKKTGLTTTDIDPVDPKQPKGMRRQKTDPTYNVAENFARRQGQRQESPWTCQTCGCQLFKGSVTSLREKQSQECIG